MDSPASRLTVHNDTNKEPSSSPFMSQVDPTSRMASKDWLNADNTTEVDIFMTPAPMRAMRSPTRHADADKENTPQKPSTVQKLSASPHKLSTPERRSPQRDGTPGSRQGTPLADLIPPPSTSRKSRTSPNKTPLKVVRSVAATPRTERREQPDMRASHLSVSRPEHTNIDDTCFSTFSEAPDMTQYARLNQSAAKRADIEQTPRSRRGEATPRVSRKRPSQSRSPSPTPRRLKTPAQTNADGTTTFLIDFTQQMDAIGSYTRASPSRASNPGLQQYIASQRSPHKTPRPSSLTTPAQKSSSILNLLDFELPPAPTPRSIPTITVRELESLKAAHHSALSSLKATLSGRDAEVESLKRAISDAERRAGESAERLREEKCAREQSEEEKGAWEQRAGDLERVLGSVREEVMASEAEKEDFSRRVEESEQRVEDAESRAALAEQRLAAALANASSSHNTAATSSSNNNDDEGAIQERVNALVAAQIDAKIEAVSRELHTIYKEKHERKVATLKKSYESRAEKKLADLTSKLAELEKQNDDLLAAKDATFSGNVDLTTMGDAAGAEVKGLKGQVEEQSLQISTLKVQIEELKAKMTGLQSMLQSSETQQEHLREELKMERIEKGELVAAVDEMLALQMQAATAPADSSSSEESEVKKNGVAATPAPQQRALSTAVEDLRRSIARPTGLRAPSASSSSSVSMSNGESRIGKSSLASSVGGGAGIPGPTARSLSGSSSSSASALGKSRMLANIERMGRMGNGSAQE